MKVTPYTEGSPQMSSVVGDQTTECIQIVFIVLVVGRGDGGCVGLRLTSCCVK